MHRALAVLVMGLLSCAASFAQTLGPDVIGVWQASGGDVTADCKGMRLEFTSDGSVVRSTGKLTYRTTVMFQPWGRGWLLQERLLSRNDGVSCNGKPATEVVEQLRHPAYIERVGRELHYHLTPEARAAIRFRRPGT